MAMDTAKRTSAALALALAVASATAMIAGCGSGQAPPQTGSGAGGAGMTGGAGGAGGSGAAATIKLEAWMDGIAKHPDVDVSTMPDDVLFKVDDKQPVAAPQAATTPAAEPGKVTVVYEEDPAKLRFLFEADPRFQAP